MIFRETEIAGAYAIDLKPRPDERGFFARSWCAEEFRDHGLSDSINQCSISYNEIAGTLRGMHFQVGADAEAKIVRCSAGAIFDVLVDLRQESATHLRWIGVELSAANRRALYVPPGVAHGFVTLADHTELFYMMDRPQAAGSARGYRYDDPAFKIDWPVPITRVSDRDLAWKPFGEAETA